jgi:2,3,4,5-tetrahydropyridine-2-carboxylate N-succinyltransferase
VEDDCFIGSRCIVTEGVLVREGAVLGANVVLTGSTPLLDVTGEEPIEHRGQVPANAIVIPGSRTKRYPAGEFQVATGLIIGWRSPRTDVKVSLNEALRAHGVAT